MLVKLWTNFNLGGLITNSAPMQKENHGCKNIYFEHFVIVNIAVFYVTFQSQLLARLILRLC